MAAAYRVGLTVAMHFKKEHKVPRPNQVYPFLVPMIPVPMHPSWPSGHATQAFLVAEALGAAASWLRDPALIVAHRIAENREVAGVHYQDDSLAGELMARVVITMLDGGPGTTPLFDALKLRAAAELNQTSAPPPP
jgi:membrane-associated phospholipid phosphatase